MWSVKRLQTRAEVERGWGWPRTMCRWKMSWLANIIDAWVKKTSEQPKMTPKLDTREWGDCCTTVCEGKSVLFCYFLIWRLLRGSRIWFNFLKGAKAWEEHVICNAMRLNSEFVENIAKWKVGREESPRTEPWGTPKDKRDYNIALISALSI